jgi:ATP-dependent Clp endopeptidase proteolytic subunit ClpP
MKNNNKSFTFYKSFLYPVSYDKYHNIFYSGSVDKKYIQILTRIIQEQNNKFLHVNENKLQLDPIKIHINSNGGDLEAGLMAYDIIKYSRIPIHTYAIGNVDSAGTLIFLAGKKRFITPHSKLLIHQLSQHECGGKHHEIEDVCYNNRLYMKDMKNIYLSEARNNISERRLDNLLKRDIYLTADQCLELGFAHELLSKNVK